MMKSAKNISIMLIVMVLAGFAIYQNIAAGDQAVNSTKEVAPRPNYIAPSFSLGGLDGQEYEVGGQRDKVLVVNFWASWCGPCVAEAPDLKRLADKYKEHLDMYAVNVTSQDRMYNVESFVKTFHFDFPVLLDQEGKVADLYRVRGLPTTFLINREGVITDVFNLINPAELERRIKQLI